MICLAQYNQWVIENGAVEPGKSEYEDRLAAPPREQRIPTRHGLVGSPISLYLSTRKKTTTIKQIAEREAGHLNILVIYSVFSLINDLENEFFGSHEPLH